MESKETAERRISGRVEEILTGWWRMGDSKFERCKSLDLSIDGALIVLDRDLPDDCQIDLHLDMEADWSVSLDATILWQRPIFFGKQQLTAVKYKFRKAADQSMFGLWMQRRLSTRNAASNEHLKPVVLSKPKQEWKPSIEPAPKVNLREPSWKKTFSQLTAKIPWTESDPLPNERRSEARGQVGLTVRCETNNESLAAEFLNVSLTGLCLFLPRPEREAQGGFFSRKPGLKIGIGEKVELVVPEDTLLLGSTRCPAEVIWSHEAELEGSTDMTGVVLGLRFKTNPQQTKRTFVGDLLRRINYNVRQVRSELRFPRTLPIVVQTDNKERIKGFTLDISAGGARVCLPVELQTPANVTVYIDLGGEDEVVHQVTLSSRLLRRTVDNEGRNCYAVAFRKGQTREHIELSRWLAGQLRVQDLHELVPNFSRTLKDEES